jgi:formiminoglutamase
MINPADSTLWRIQDDPASGSHWRHFVRFTNPNDASEDLKDSIALIGMACDEGVRRNHGRPGAKDGPDAIRKALARLVWHGDRPVFDAGNVFCDNRDLESTAQDFSNFVGTLLQAGAFPVGLGGGHEMAFGTYLGIRRHIGKARLGIVNFDAHFDLRKPSDGLANSGTPFYQIAEHCRENGTPFLYHCIGLQFMSNMEVLFERARKLHSGWTPAESVWSHDLSPVRDALRSVVEACDYLYISCCLDVFSAAFAPGVSAVNPVGLFPDAVFVLYRDLFASGKVIAADIAELNPQYDIDHRTARLAAALVYIIRDCLNS